MPAPNLLVNQYILFTAGTGASYFSYTVPNDTIGSISVRVESNTTGDIQLQSQSRTIPTIDYAAETYNSTQSKIIQTVIVNPFVADGLSWYFGVFNKGVPCFVNISLSIQGPSLAYLLTFSPFLII